METIVNITEWFNNLDITWKRLLKRHIDINHKPSEEEIQYMLNLTEFDCSQSQIISLDPVKHLQKLRSLNCSKTNIVKLDKLSELYTLEILNISETPIDSLLPIHQLRNLKSLNCSLTKIISLDGLNTLENLTDLNCSFNKITSLDPLKYLLNLSNINLEYTQINSIKTIEHLVNSASINIEFTPYKDAMELAQNLNQRDELFSEAARQTVITQQGSTSLLQRKLKLGYNRAGRIMDQLEHAGIVSAFNGSTPRLVLIKSEQELQKYLKSNLNIDPAVEAPNQIDPPIEENENLSKGKKGFWKSLFG